jgi:hypothetical protein
MSQDGHLSDLARTGDAGLLEKVRRMWAERDPVPEDLAERIRFALDLEDLEIELLELERARPVLSGHRGEERVRTLTFTSDSLSVMVSITPVRGEVMRIDGWISDGSGLDVELRLKAGTRRERADAQGRFAFDGVGGGLVQFLFHPTTGAGRELAHTVVTPAVQL